MPSQRIEKKVIGIMITMYCRRHHKTDNLCDACDHLLAYAFKKIEICPQRINKPKCSDCKVHCFSTKQREEIRKVMRYSGKRMLFRHPILTLRHYLPK